MAKGTIRRCPTCKVDFPTIDAVNDHYKQTSHAPLPYKCESCERVYTHIALLLMVGIQLSISWAHGSLYEAYSIETSTLAILQLWTLQSGIWHYDVVQRSKRKFSLFLKKACCLIQPGNWYILAPGIHISSISYRSIHTCHFYTANLAIEHMKRQPDYKW